MAPYLQSNKQGFDMDQVIFKGTSFRRYPNSPHRADRYYYQCSKGSEVAGERYLHRAKWAVENGPIPEGCHIHHKDGNSLNNDLENLECLPEAEHLSQDGRRRTLARQEQLKLLRSKAAEWHRSEEGREWHERLGKRLWEEREPEEHTCDQCGKIYETKTFGETRFCSNACKAKARRERGDDDEQRECVICGETFIANKYDGTKTCSASCAGKLSWQKRKEDSV